MMLSMAGYVLNDMFMKLVFPDVGLFQAIFIRGLFATTFMALLAWRMNVIRPPQGAWKTASQPPILWRTLSEIGATVFFLTALFNMDIANVTAVLQLLPLTITLGAALILGETVGWRRYGAILTGFLGVLLIVRPGTEGFNIFSLSALAATVCVTARDLITRKLPKDTPSVFVSLLTAGAITLMGAIGSLFTPWSSVTSTSLLYLSAAALILMAGYIFSILAMREGEVSFIPPFRYSILIWALVIGYFVFDELPDSLALTGALIVVCSGLFTFYRERVRKIPLQPDKA